MAESKPQQDTPQKQPEALQDKNYLTFEASYGRELTEKIRSNFIHCVKPQNILSIIHEHDSEVLLQRDTEEIRCAINTKGDIAGAECLLDQLVRYRGWLSCLLGVLRDDRVKQSHVADEIEDTIVKIQQEKKMQTPERRSTPGSSGGVKRSSSILTIVREIKETIRISDPPEDTLEKVMSPTKEPATCTYVEVPNASISPSALVLTGETPEKVGSSTEDTSITREIEHQGKEKSEDQSAGAAASVTHLGASGSLSSSSQILVESHIDSTSHTADEQQKEGETSENTVVKDVVENIVQTKHLHKQRSADVKKRDIHLLLVGKTGNGKSSLGNSILRKKAFQYDTSLSSCTKEAQFDYSEFNGIVFKVVDGPGIGDTDLTKEDSLNLVTNAMTDAICVNAEGYHAILVVVRYGGKFTEEDVTTLKILKEIFGEGFIKDHAILVMTCGDNFSRDQEDEGINTSFHQWCDRQKGAFADLLKEVEKRAVLFDNKTKDDSLRSDQIWNLVDAIDGLSTKGKQYNHEIFNNARKTRDQVIAESKLQFLQDHVLREVALISQRFRGINFDNLEKVYKDLDRLLEETEDLKHSITEQDRDTGTLSSTIVSVDNLISLIKADIKEVKERKWKTLKGRQEMNLTSELDIQVKQPEKTKTSEVTRDLEKPKVQLEKAERKQEFEELRKRQEEKERQWNKKIAQREEKRAEKKRKELAKKEMGKQEEDEKRRNIRKEDEQKHGSKDRTLKRLSRLDSQLEKEEAWNRIVDTEKQLKSESDTLKRQDRHKEMEMLREERRQKELEEHKICVEGDEESKEQGKFDSKGQIKHQKENTTEREESKNNEGIQTNEEEEQDENEPTRDVPEGDNIQTTIEQDEQGKDAVVLRRKGKQKVEETAKNLREHLLAELEQACGRIRQDEKESYGYEESYSDMDLLKKEHECRADKIEETYRSIKDEKTKSLLARMRSSVAKFFSAKVEWLRAKYSRSRSSYTFN